MLSPVPSVEPPLFHFVLSIFHSSLCFLPWVVARTECRPMTVVPPLWWAPRCGHPYVFRGAWSCASQKWLIWNKPQNLRRKSCFVETQDVSPAWNCYKRNVMCLLPVSELCFSKPCLPEEKGTSSRMSHWERVCALSSSQSHSGEGTRKNTVGYSLPRGEDNPQHLKEGRDSAVGAWDSWCPQITWGKHLLYLRHLVTQ